MSKVLVPDEIGRKVLVVGEYYKGAPGGIAAVLQYYSRHWPVFKFIASSRRGTVLDKIVYDAGGLLLLFLRLLVDWKIRVVHIHTAAGGSFLKHRYYAALARVMGRKVVMHSHASRFKVFYSEASRRQKESILSSLNSVDRLIVLSRSWKEWFESIGVEPSKIRILNNITSRAELAHVPSADGVMRLLFLGEIGERKGVFDLLRAVSMHRGPFEGRVRIHVGGNGQVDRLLETIRTDSLEGIVFFEGFVSGGKKEELLAHSDIFILPSFNEGLPISILEAMSHGCAIVSTPVGGIPEVVSGNNGILVEPGDAEAIADAVLSLVRDPERVSAMGRSSLEVVRDFYPEPVMEHLLAIYGELVSGR